jgi:hypothetical protein
MLVQDRRRRRLAFGTDRRQSASVVGAGAAILDAHPFNSLSRGEVMAEMQDGVVTSVLLQESGAGGLAQEDGGCRARDVARIA